MLENKKIKVTFEGDTAEVLSFMANFSVVGDESLDVASGENIEPKAVKKAEPKAVKKAEPKAVKKAEPKEDELTLSELAKKVAGSVGKDKVKDVIATYSDSGLLAGVKADKEDDVREALNKLLTSA